MSEARKIIDWHGQNDLASDLDGVPPGRYVLVPEDEYVADSAEIDAVNEGILAADRGELVDYDDVRSELGAIVTYAKAPRGT